MPFPDPVVAPASLNPVKVVWDGICVYTLPEASYTKTAFVEGDPSIQRGVLPIVPVNAEL
jgi:hypothetical protein